MLRTPTGSRSRVSLRIAAAMMPALVVVLSVFGVASAWREGEVVEQEMQRDADDVATSVALFVAADAPDRDARIAALDRALPHLRIRVVGPEAGDEPLAGYVTAREPLRDAAGRVLAHVEVTEPRSDRDAFVVRALIADAIGVAVATLIAAAFAVAVGRVLVERRVDAVIRQLAQVGRGELPDRPLALGADELGVLGRAVNDMIDQLQAANDRARAEGDARQRAQLQLRRADRLAVVGKTTAVFAHELGTPLAVVVGRADRLLRTLGDDPQRAAVVTIREQADRMTSAIRRLLDYARHDDSLLLRPIDLAPVLGAAATLASDRATAAGVDVDVADGAELPVNADPQAMLQVLTNLLHNAIDASPRGSTVSMTGGVDGDRVVVTVGDRGPGVADDLKERVFDPFFTTKPSGEGTGLGLAIVQEIVHDHGGRVTLIDRAGGGLTVRVELPVREVARA